MKDLQAGLLALSERGTPIGSHRLRERVAMALADAHLEPEHAHRRWPGPALALAAAALVIVLFGGVALFLNWHREEIAVTTTVAPSTTVAPTTTAATETTVTVPAVAPPAVTPLERTPPELQMTWQELSPGVFDGSRLDAVITAGPGLLAVGSADDGTQSTNWSANLDLLFGDAAVWTSPDAAAWSRVPDGTGAFAGHPGGSEYDQYMADVAVWNGQFVAVGAGGPIWSDTDAAVWLSSDGMTWNRVYDPPDIDYGWDSGNPPVAGEDGGAQHMAAVVAGGPGLIAVGSGGGAVGGVGTTGVWLSADGLDWTELDPDAVDRGECGGRNVFDVAAGGPGFIAAGVAYCDSGERAAVWVSPDGTSWQQILLDPGMATAVNNSSARTIAVGPHGIAVVGRVGDVDASNGGRGIDHSFGAVWLSEDGVEWRLAAVLDHGDLPDATSWTYGASADAALWNRDRLLVFGTARQVPCGGAGYALVWASADRGQTWHLVAMDKADQAAGPEVAYAPRQVGWATRCSPASLMGDAVVFGSQVVVVGASPNFGSGIVWIGEWVNG